MKKSLTTSHLVSHWKMIFQLVKWSTFAQLLFLYFISQVDIATCHLMLYCNKLLFIDLFNKVTFRIKNKDFFVLKFSTKNLVEVGFCRFVFQKFGTSNCLKLSKYLYIQFPQKNLKTSQQKKLFFWWFLIFFWKIKIGESQ